MKPERNIQWRVLPRESQPGPTPGTFDVRDARLAVYRGGILVDTVALPKGWQPDDLPALAEKVVKDTPLLRPLPTAAEAREALRRTERCMEAVRRDAEEGMLNAARRWAQAAFIGRSD